MSKNIISRVFLIPILMVVVLWVVEIIEQLFGLRFTAYGIYPRDINSLTGIFTTIFIHSDWQHLIANSFPVLFLGVIFRYFYIERFWAIYAVITIFTGVLVWLFARNSYHIGISGLVYGLITFLFASGFFRSDSKSIIIALTTLVFYSGYFLGFKPEEGVSWESHIFGSVTGIFTAFLFKKFEFKMLSETDHVSVDNYPKKRFFASDTFVLTKEERYLRSLMEEE